jgi:hypothetical protein
MEQAYHIVTPVPHCLFEIVGAAIRFAKALKSFDAKQPFLFLFSDATHGTTQGCGHGEIGLQVAQQFLVIFVENGNLDVDQKSQFLTEGSQGSVAVYGADQQLIPGMKHPNAPVMVSSRSLTRIAPLVGLVALGSTLS